GRRPPRARRGQLRDARRPPRRRRGGGAGARLLPQPLALPLLRGLRRGAPARATVERAGRGAAAREPVGVGDGGRLPALPHPPRRRRGAPPPPAGLRRAPRGQPAPRRRGGPPRDPPGEPRRGLARTGTTAGRRSGTDGPP